MRSRWWQGYYVPADVIGTVVWNTPISLSVGYHGISTSWHFRNNPYYFYDIPNAYYVDPFDSYYDAYFADDPYRYTYTPAYGYEGDRYVGQRAFYAPTVGRLARAIYIQAIQMRRMGIPGHRKLYNAAFRYYKNFWDVRRAAWLQPTRKATYAAYLNLVNDYTEFRASVNVSSPLITKTHGLFMTLGYPYEHAARYED